MPITINDHLKHDSNRRLLIVISESNLTHTILDEQDCCTKLLRYGSIKKIQLTDDRRAAFVDFECEHTPLLVARCFELHQSNPGVPMPSGATALLPGCSINNFLYLTHVPRFLPNVALFRHFSKWDNGRPVTIIRPGSAGAISSRVVIVLRKDLAAGFYTRDRIRLDYLADDSSGRTFQFYAIPQLLELTNYTTVFESGGCKECNVDSLRESVKLEDEKKRRKDAAERENALKQASLKRHDENYSTPRSASPKFPDITEESERKRWGIIDRKQVSPPPPPVPPPVKKRSTRKEVVLDWKNWKDPKEEQKKKEFSPSPFPMALTINPSFTPDKESDVFKWPEVKELSPSSLPSFGTIKPSVTPFDTAEDIIKRPETKEPSPSSLPSFGTIKPSCSPFDTADDVIKRSEKKELSPSSPPCFGTIKPYVNPFDNAEAVIDRPETKELSPSSLPCFGTIKPSFTQFESDVVKSPAALPLKIQEEKKADEVPLASLPSAQEAPACATEAPESATEASERSRETPEPLAPKGILKCREGGWTNQQSTMNEIQKESPPKTVRFNESAEFDWHHAALNAPVFVPRAAMKEEIVKENRDIAKNEETREGGSSNPITIGDYLKKESNRCLLIVIGRTKLYERDCNETLRHYGRIKKIQFTPTRRVAFVEFDCNHAPILALHCFGYQGSNRVRIPLGVAALLPGCSSANFVYLQVPPSLPTTALQMYMDDWCKGSYFTIHRSGNDFDHTNLPSQHVVIELIGGKEASSLFKPTDRVQTREIKFSGHSHLFFAVPNNTSFTDTSCLLDVRACTNCKIRDFRWIVEDEERKKRVEEERRKKMMVDEEKKRIAEAEMAREHCQQGQMKRWTSVPLELKEEKKSEETSDDSAVVQGVGQIDRKEEPGWPQQYKKLLASPLPGQSLSAPYLTYFSPPPPTVAAAPIVTDETESGWPQAQQHTELFASVLTGDNPYASNYSSHRGAASIIDRTGSSDGWLETMMDAYLSEDDGQEAVETRDVREMPEGGQDEVPQRREERGTDIDLSLAVHMTSLEHRPVNERGEETEQAIASIVNEQSMASSENEARPGVDSGLEQWEKTERTSFDSLEKEEEEERDSRSAVTLATPTEKTEDVIVDESEHPVDGREDVVIVEESVDLMPNGGGQDLTSALISTHEMAADASDVIVEESERFVDGREDVDVDEPVETEEGKETIESGVVMMESVANSDGPNEKIESSEWVIDPFCNGDSTSTLDVINEAPSSIDYETASSCYSEDEYHTANEIDSDDLLSGEEDQWTSAGSRPSSRLSLPFNLNAVTVTVEETKKAHDFAADDAPQLVVMMEEEEETNDEVGDVIDRMDVPSPTPSPTESLEHEDTVSSRSDSSDEENNNHDHVSDSSAVSCESSDTVVGERGYGRFVVDTDELDVKNQINIGYKRLSTIEEESQEEDALSSMCSTQEVFMSEEEEEERRMRLIDGDKEEEEEVPEEKRRDDHCITPVAIVDVRMIEKVEEKMEVEQREAISSSVPIRRWNRRSMVDQEEEKEDYRSTENEYHNWLTREDADSRGESIDGTSSESEMVPLPSSLSVPTWGTGIVIEENITVVTVLPEEKSQ